MCKIEYEHRTTIYNRYLRFSQIKISACSTYKVLKRLDAISVNTNRNVKNRPGFALGFLAGFFGMSCLRDCVVSEGKGRAAGFGVIRPGPIDRAALRVDYHNLIKVTTILSRPRQAGAACWQ
ncbi:MAG TPA: hypothetical protein VLX29_09895 [Nitrospirota bacterium]|nr:hypothetical protein [Nitrospirota bacterium]